LPVPALFDICRGNLRGGAAVEALVAPAGEAPLLTFVVDVGAELAPTAPGACCVGPGGNGGKPAGEVPVVVGGRGPGGKGAGGDIVAAPALEVVVGVGGVGTGVTSTPAVVLGAIALLVPVTIDPFDSAAGSGAVVFIVGLSAEAEADADAAAAGGAGGWAGFGGKFWIG
jgi:hypothetical protein